MFAHLHCHSLGSFSDSILRIEYAVKKAAEDGQKAIAITDHGTLVLPFKLITECEKYSIKPIVGCEFYFVENAKASIKKDDNSRYHTVLLAKNKKGLKNLIAIINNSWEYNNYQHKRGLVDWNLLEKYSAGLICLTGCFWNIISRTYHDSTEEEAENKFKRFYDIFSDDLYVELSRHGVKDEEESNNILLKFASKYGVKAVVANDAHYLNKNDSFIHDTYIKSRFREISSFQYDGTGFYLKTIKEMKELSFKEEYLHNTLKVADKCNIGKESFISGSFNEVKGSINLTDAFDRGFAAYVPEIATVSLDRAIQICGELDRPSHLKKIEGLWRDFKVNFNRVAVSIEKPLNKITPCFVWKGLRVCQFSEKHLIEQAIEVRDVVQWHIKTESR